MEMPSPRLPKRELPIVIWERRQWLRTSDWFVMEDHSPLTRFRPAKWLSADDIFHQSLCEMHLEFKMRSNILPPEEGVRWFNEEEVLCKVLDARGPVDTFAIRGINLLLAIGCLKSGKVDCWPEVPIFGFIGGRADALVAGRIYELRNDFHLENGAAVPITLKKARLPYLTSEPVKRALQLQMLMYQHFLRNFVKQAFSMQRFTQSVNVDVDTNVSPHIQQFLNEEIPFDFPELAALQATKQLTLRKIFTGVLSVFKDFNLSGTSYFIDQDEGSGYHRIYRLREQNEKFKKLVKSFMIYWDGDRKPTGIPREAAEMCTSCPFGQWCRVKPKKPGAHDIEDLNRISIFHLNEGELTYEADPEDRTNDTVHPEHENEMQEEDEEEEEEEEGENQAESEESSEKSEESGSDSESLPGVTDASHRPVVPATNESGSEEMSSESNSDEEDEDEDEDEEEEEEEVEEEASVEPPEYTELDKTILISDEEEPVVSQQKGRKRKRTA